jgi:hypothetical protein
MPKGQFALDLLNVDKQWLITKYYEEKLTMREIATLLGGCTAVSVQSWMEKEGLERRRRGGVKGRKWSPRVIAIISRAQRLRRSREVKPEPIMHLCARCGGQFQRKPQKGAWQKCCSIECSAAMRRGVRRKDPRLVRLSIFMRNCIHRLGVKTKKLDRLQAYSETILGYTREELRTHIESLFTDGMTWENYGGCHHGRNNTWVIDHIVPINFYLASGVEDPRVVNRLDNLRPLWSKENHLKGYKVMHRV